MTAYSISTAGVSNGELGIRAGSAEIRLTVINMYNNSTNNYAIGVERIAATGFSGGSTVGINPLRDGAPPTTATARIGNISVPGTEYKLFQFTLSSGSASSDGLYSTASAATASGQSPLPITIAPGDALIMAAGDQYVGITVFFDEMNIAGSY